jgi:chaperonin cofactor prefoldin
MTTHDISQLPAVAQAYIHTLQTQVSALNERIQQLEEQFRLAQSKRFAPSSEKRQDRVFDEAEQAAVDPAPISRTAGSLLTFWLYGEMHE